MFEVAKLDDDGTLIDVVPVAENEWVTDPKKKQFQLLPNHDMRNHLYELYYDWQLGTFRPIGDKETPQQKTATELLASVLLKTAEKLAEKEEIELTNEEKVQIARFKNKTQR